MKNFLSLLILSNVLVSVVMAARKDIIKGFSDDINRASGATVNSVAKYLARRQIFLDNLNYILYPDYFDYLASDNRRTDPPYIPPTTTATTTQRYTVWDLSRKKRDLRKP